MGPRTWDLRGGRAMPPAGRWEVCGEVTILLPGGRVFSGRDVTVRAFGAEDEIETLEILFPRTTLDAGYRRAVQLGREWLLDTRSLDAWYRAARGQGGGVRYYVGMPGSPLAPGGPTPAASVLDSFDDREPFLLELEFRWSRAATIPPENA